MNIEPDEGERREPNTAKLATLCGRLVEFIIYSWFASSIQGQCLWVATLKITFCIDTPFFLGTAYICLDLVKRAARKRCTFTLWHCEGIGNFSNSAYACAETLKRNIFALAAWLQRATGTLTWILLTLVMMRRGDKRCLIVHLHGDTLRLFPTWNTFPCAKLDWTSCTYGT